MIRFYVSDMVLPHQIFPLSETNQEAALKNNQQVNLTACVPWGLSGSVQQPCLSVSSKPSTGPVDRAGGILEQSLEMGNSMEYEGATLALVGGGQRVAGNVARKADRAHINKHIDFQV